MAMMTPSGRDGIIGAPLERWALGPQERNARQKYMQARTETSRSARPRRARQLDASTYPFPAHFLFGIKGICSMHPFGSEW